MQLRQDVRLDVPLVVEVSDSIKRRRGKRERKMVALNTNAGSRKRFVEIPAGRRNVAGVLSLPREPVGVVVFAHGSGSGRFSPRNRFVAHALQNAGLGTLLIDLLREDETPNQRNVFDIKLLAERLVATTCWLGLERDTRDLTLGYFGASTGAAAAMVAAARRPEYVGAVVLRSGRADLAWGDLVDVVAPTLMIVGEHDEQILESNRLALALLRCRKRLVVVPGATHLFEEPGALEQAARLAEEWFLGHLDPNSRANDDPPSTSTVETVPTESKQRSEPTGGVP
jgi:putative phosphoribosyl transferase